MLLERLAEAAETVGDAIKESLLELAQKLEVNLAVLWEDRLENDLREERLRKQAVDRMSLILKQIKLWKEIERVHDAQDAMEIC